VRLARLRPVLFTALGAAGCTDFHLAAGVDGGADGAPVHLALDAPREADANGRADASAPVDARADAHLDGAPTDARSVCTGAGCGIEIMVKNLQQPVGLAVDATYLYWIEQGVIGDGGAGDYGELARMRKDMPCNTASCAFTVLDPLVLAGDGIYNSTLAVGPTAVCYSQTFNAMFAYSVNCVFLGTGNEANLAQGTGYVQGIWVGPSGAVWANNGSMTGIADGLVEGASFDGGMQTVAGKRPGPWGVTSDGAEVFWTESGLDAGTGAVLGARGDVGVQPLATAQAAPSGIAASGGYVYWVDAAAGTVLRAASTGTGSVETVAENQPGPFAIAVDANGIYWANAGTPFQNDTTGGSIAHVISPSGTVSIDLPNLTNVFGVAIDGAYVYAVLAGTYAADYTDGEIERVGRAP